MAKPNDAQAAWEFTEDFDVNVAPPAAPQRTPRRFEMPFASKFFTPALEVALAGKKPHKFVPKTFFLQRAEKPEKVDGKYMKAKIRDQFNKWLKQQSPEISSQLTILLIERNGREPEFPEAGVSIWILKSDKTA